MVTNNKVLILGTSDSGGVSVYVSSYLNELTTINFMFHYPKVIIKMQFKTFFIKHN